MQKTLEIKRKKEYAHFQNQLQKFDHYNSPNKSPQMIFVMTEVVKSYRMKEREGRSTHCYLQQTLIIKLWLDMKLKASFPQNPFIKR